MVTAAVLALSVDRKLFFVILSDSHSRFEVINRLASLFVAVPECFQIHHRLLVRKRFLVLSQIICQPLNINPLLFELLRRIRRINELSFQIIDIVKGKHTAGKCRNRRHDLCIIHVKLCVRQFSAAILQGKI